MTDLTVSVAAGADDGHCKHDGSSFSNSVNYAIMGKSGSDPYRSFYRVDNVTIPNGATIESAKLTIRSGSSRAGDTVDVIVHCEDADDPLAPSDGSDVIGRSLTTGTAWNSVVSFSFGTHYDSVDFTSDVQEVVDRGGWASGQAMIVNILDNGSTTNDYRNSGQYDFSGWDADFVVSYTDALVAGSVETIDVSDTSDAFNLTDGTTDTVSLIDFSDAYLMAGSSEETIGISDASEAGFEHQRDSTDTITISDESEAFAEAQADETDTVDVTTVSDAFNYSAWLRQNEAKAKQRFFFTLTGEADLTTDVEIPVSTIYVTKRVVDPTDVQVSIPSFNYSLDVALRPNGRMIIDLGYDIDGEIDSDLREIIAEANLDTISTYEGGDSRSIVLTGRKVNTYGANIITLDEADLVYRGLGERARNYRFAKINPFLNPGDTVIIRDFTEDDAQEAFTCNTVIYTINDFSSIMELSEAL